MSMAAVRIAALLLGFLAARPALPAGDVPDAAGLRPLLHAAWEQGAAAMRLVGGPLPGMFRRFHSADGGLFADVRVVERFKEPGCARYEIVFVQRGARGGSGARTDADSLRIGLNYCLDGSAPGSAMDIDLLGELLHKRGRQP